MEQLSFADVDPAAEPTLRDTTFVVVDLETTGGRATATSGQVRRDHRNRGGQGPRRSGACRVRHAGRSRPRYPPADRAANRHHLGDGMRRAENRRSAADVHGVRPRRGAGRPQRRLRHRLSQSGGAALRHRLAAAAGAVHGAPGPPGAQPRGGAQRAAGRTREAVRGGHAAHPPGARRRQGHRRRPAHADRAGWQPGRAHVHRSARLSAECDCGTTTQAGVGRWACRTGPACICSAARPPRCSTSGRRSTCAAGSVSTSPAAIPAPGSPRW